jgi:hypothetical protein
MQYRLVVGYKKNTNISGQSVGPIVKSETLACLTIAVGTDSLPQMSVHHCQTMLHNVPEDENFYCIVAKT